MTVAHSDGREIDDPKRQIVNRPLKLMDLTTTVEPWLWIIILARIGKGDACDKLILTSNAFVVVKTHNITGRQTKLAACLSSNTTPGPPARNTK